MYQKKSLLGALLGLALITVGCTQAGMHIDNVTSKGAADSDQPCWVETPECNDPTKEYLYFTGQSPVVIASESRPPGMAYNTADLDAKAKYSAYLKDKVGAKAVGGGQLAGDQGEGAEMVATYKEMGGSFAEATQNGLKRVDSYAVSEAKNSKGVPLWTTYTLMRVPRSLLSEKFDKLTKRIEEAASEGDPEAKSVLKGIQTVNDQMKKDSFFDDL